MPNANSFAITDPLPLRHRNRSSSPSSFSSLRAAAGTALEVGGDCNSLVINCTRGCAIEREQCGEFPYNYSADLLSMLKRSESASGQFARNAAVDGSLQPSDLLHMKVTRTQNSRCNNVQQVRTLASQTSSLITPTHVVKHLVHVGLQKITGSL